MLGMRAAICEAIGRPEPFPSHKSIERQDLQALHGIRSRLIGGLTCSPFSARDEILIRTKKGRSEWRNGSSLMSRF